MIVFVVAVIIGATGAFFSDSETSTGNTLSAGAIDLQVDNTSYYNGAVSSATSWTLRDLTIERFFDFNDLKPGDIGEDTISLHVNNNDSWLCADITLTSDDDNGLTEPEGDDGDTSTTTGELADQINFTWWADDGDNVLEDDETPLPAGPLGALEVGETATVALADSDENIWTTGTSTPLPGDSVRYVGKAWCYGVLTASPLTQDGLGTTSPRTPANSTGGLTCDGTGVDNTGQTDSTTADITFRAVQSRNNGTFQCVPEDPQEPTTGTLTVTKIVINDNTGTSTVSDFALFVDGSPVTSGVLGTTTAGAHVVSEGPTTGYQASFSGDCDGGGNVVVPAGGSASCTITNDDIGEPEPEPGTLTVTKVVVNDSGGTATTTDFSLFVDSMGIVSGSSTTTSAGIHTVTESGLFGYTATFSGDCNASGNVTVPAGGVATCTITNDDIQPVITLIKNVVGGTAVADDFDLSINSGVVTSGSSNGVSANTSHELDEEVLVTGYTQTSVTGSSFLGIPCPATFPGNIFLAPGDTITCTVTNTFAN